MIKIKKFIISIAFILMLLPTTGLYAQENVTCSGEVHNISELLNIGQCIINKSLLPLLILIAIVVFIVGVIKYLANAEDSTKRTEGRNFMIYGIIALFVMISFWGFVGILQGTFNLGNNVLIPQLQGV